MDTIFSWLLGLIGMLRPRFVFSKEHSDCREEVKRIADEVPVIAIRLNVINYGWMQDDPPPCDVLLKKVTFEINGATHTVMSDESRLIWKDTKNEHRMKVTKNRLINICSVAKERSPVLTVWSQQGEAGYSINRGPGIYTFHLATLCKGSSPGTAILNVSFDPSSDWSNIRIVSMKPNTKWRTYAYDAVVIILILISGGALYGVFS